MKYDARVDTIKVLLIETEFNCPHCGGRISLSVEADTKRKKAVVRVFGVHESNEIINKFLNEIKTEREREKELYNLVKSMIKANKGQPIRVKDLVKTAKEKGYDEKYVKKKIEKWRREGRIYEPRAGWIDVTEDIT